MAKDLKGGPLKVYKFPKNRKSKKKFTCKKKNASTNIE